ncbi:hypothetical protein FisN_34Hh017 [Fistulifera solaris]|uniref:Limiting CO2-inducible protein B/C beta carbonyic anhydrase domain-containing protein n=1 Tax=Fistulifera solaris TaxID=1519565 RepID=A0A1Z5KRJ8_FISSO|nr:hypothetical protein FisN_34Hh017 [Fistulifera solaris]|eukprot:GAX28807.1 hypothetical protein FisN_34Hh017 [Fistulifera solaris]
MVSGALLPLPSQAADNYPYKTCVAQVANCYKNAVTNAELVQKVYAALQPYGYGPDTLVATSLCSDEVNRPLEESLQNYFGSHFTLGGLAGFPFAGLSGFMAMTSRMPDSCLVVYGPHVGISADGQIGKLQRRGQRQLGTCCGSAIAAAQYASAVYRGDAAPVRSIATALDAQQAYVASTLLPYAAQIEQALDPMVELPYALFQPMDDMMLQIVTRADVDANTRIAMLGGIQINTPVGLSDYFLPLRFDVRDNQGNVIEDLMWRRTPGPRRKVPLSA